MVLTTIPLALNALACVTVWMSNLPVIGKIVITVILIAKFATYFCTALMDSSDRARSFGLVSCIIANALYIRKYNPILNTQIPKAENWERWETKSVDAKSILESIL